MRTTLLLALLLVLPLTSALSIQAIYYDAFNEATSEHIVLHNDEDVVIDVTGWTIATPSSQQDATLEGLVLPGDDLIVADLGYDELRDNASWPEADHLETLSLPNGGGFVQVIDLLGQVRDQMGYGQTEISNGNPHPGTAEGEWLRRTQATGDDATDFVAEQPWSLPEPAATNGSTEIRIDVAQAAPRILSITIPDEDLDMPGIQVVAIAGGQALIELTVSVEDNNSVREVHAMANGINLTSNDTGRMGNFTGSLTIEGTSENITVTVTDGTTTLEETVLVDVVSAISLDVPEILELEARPGETISAPLRVRNTGNVPLDLHVHGTQPRMANTVLGTVHYWIGGVEYLLEQQPRAHAIGLQGNEELDIELDVSAGYVPTGAYTGQVIIAGVVA